MSLKLRNALMVSLEADDVELMNPVTDQQETNIDEVLLEINEAAEPVAEADQVVDVLETAEASVESLAVALEGYIADGGMSPQTAQAHNVGMANALRGLPLDADRFTVSSESFGGHGDKLTASQEALEKVKETLDKLWEGIKNAVKKAFAAVATFIATIGTSSRAIKAAGVALVKKAASTSGKAEGEMEATAAAKALHKGNGLNQSVGSMLKEIAAGGKGVAASAKAAEGALNTIAGEIASGHYTDDNASRAAFAETVMKSLPSGELPGGYTIEVSDASVPTLTQTSPLNLKEVKVKVPELAEIKMIGQGIQEVADFLNSYSTSTFKSLQASVEKFIANQDKLVKKAGFSKEETAKTRDGLKATTKLAAVARGCGPQYLRYAASAAKAAYSFGNKALAQYK